VTAVLKFELDRVANAAYAQVSDEPVQSTREIDGQRVIDYGASGDIVGIEFLDVSHGVSLSELPYHDELARYFGKYQIQLFA
jgi:uncharacterized protein YuzE